jgi:exonuclease III
VWVGDLNVAHTPADVTHPQFFKSQMPQKNEGDSGQAGYTMNERLRFSNIIKDGELVDTYRHFNPVPLAALDENLHSHTSEDRILDPSGPTYTWRGTAGRDIKESGRYYGKGMRIDYAMVGQFILRMYRI